MRERVGRVRAVVHRICIWGRVTLSDHRIRIHAIARMAPRGVGVTLVRLRERGAIGWIGWVHDRILGRGRKGMHKDRTRIGSCSFR